VTASFPEVVTSFEDMPGSFALDGELVPFTAEGRPRPFQALQAMAPKRGNGIVALARKV